MRSCGGLPAPGQAGAVSSLLSPSLSFPLMQSSTPTRGSSLLAPPLALSIPPAFPLRRRRHASSARPRPSPRFPPSPLTPPAYSRCCARRRSQRLRAPRFPAAWPAVALLPSSLPPTSPLVAGRPRRRRAPPGARLAGPFPCRCRGARPAAPLHSARHPEDARARPPGIARYDGNRMRAIPSQAAARRLPARACGAPRRAALCRRVPVVAAGLLGLVRKVGLEQRHEVAVGIHDYCVLAGLALYNVAVHPYALGL